MKLILSRLFRTNVLKLNIILKNKKVLLRESKKHTARHVASTCRGVPVGCTPHPDLGHNLDGGTPLSWPWDGGPPILTWDGIIPLSWPGMGVPLSWPGMGYPPPVSQMGVSPQKWTYTHPWKQYLPHSFGMRAVIRQNINSIDTFKHLLHTIKARKHTYIILCATIERFS